MILLTHHLPRLCVVALLGCLVGCGGDVEHPALTTFNVDEVTGKAMQQLDTNADGQLTKEELAASPGLSRALTELDTDRDRMLSAAELRARLQLYIDARVAIYSFPILVTYHRKPLAGPTVKLFPEAFLEGVIQPAEGVTDETGYVYPSIELDEELRERGTKGFRSGVYRVEVVKLDNTGKEQIPARYNVDSELGLEIKMEEHMDTIQIDL